jgi:hypothetical protein
MNGIVLSALSELIKVKNVVTGGGGIVINNVVLFIYSFFMRNRLMAVF